MIGRQSKEERDAQDAKAARRAQDARAITENPLFADAFEAVKDKHLQAIQDSAPRDKDARENAYHALRILKMVRQELEAEIQGGALAAKRMKEDL